MIRIEDLSDREWSAGLGCHLLDRFVVWSPQDAVFGDDGGDVFCRGDIEGRVLDGGAGGRHLATIGVSDFGGAALLDGNEIAVRGGKVDRGKRRSDVEGDAVFLGEDRYGIGANLVGSIPIGSDAVSAHDDRLNAALAHESAGHVVAENSSRD